VSGFYLDPSEDLVFATSDRSNEITERFGMSLTRRKKRCI
jgi:hypothetical protein